MLDKSVESVKSVRDKTGLCNVLICIWIVILIILNVIPLGNELNEGLSTKGWGLRLDYLFHLITFLMFGWIYVLGRITNRNAFSKNQISILISVILVLSVCLELVQIFIPYRAFNPVDLVYNLIGALLSVLAILVSNRVGGALDSHFRGND